MLPCLRHGPTRTCAPSLCLSMAPSGFAQPTVLPQASVAPVPPQPSHNPVPHWGVVAAASLHPTKHTVLFRYNGSPSVPRAPPPSALSTSIVAIASSRESRHGYSLHQSFRGFPSWLDSGVPPDFPCSRLLPGSSHHLHHLGFVSCPLTWIPILHQSLLLPLSVRGHTSLGGGILSRFYYIWTLFAVFPP